MCQISTVENTRARWECPAEQIEGRAVGPGQRGRQGGLGEEVTCEQRLGGCRVGGWALQRLGRRTFWAAGTASGMPKASMSPGASRGAGRSQVDPIGHCEPSEDFGDDWEQGGSHVILSRGGAWSDLGFKTVPLAPVPLREDCGAGEAGRCARR